jgi:dGTPase
VVRAADIMAYIAHDTDDAIRGGVIRRKQLPQGPGKVLGRSLSQQIDTMVRDVITCTMEHGGERLCHQPPGGGCHVGVAGFSVRQCL